MPQPDLFNPADDTISSGKIRMIMELRNQGVRDHRLLAAMEAVPRERFTPPMFRTAAYDARDLPIAGGQSLSAPATIARMLSALEVTERDVVLEIGTGSGYQAAVLCRLARRVLSVECYRELRDEAQERITALGCRNVTLLHGDGHAGWPEAAPYDRIITTVAMRAVPPALLEQLSERGVLLIAIGTPGKTARLMRIRRDNWNYHTETLGDITLDTAHSIA